MSYRLLTNNSTSVSTPLYQVISHALPDPANRTKFTLVYSNVTEADILLRSEIDALQKKYPNKLEVVYALDKPPAGWTGPDWIHQQGFTQEVCRTREFE